MFRRVPLLFAAALLLLLTLTACLPAANELSTESATEQAEDSVATEEITGEPDPQAEAEEPGAEEEEAAPAEVVETGEDPYPDLLLPDDMPRDINPLTGQPLEDPDEVWSRRPIVIKVSNEGMPVRPQSGLSYADHVWMYQMEGWAQTRYTAIIWSQSPAYVGSVRSVRLLDSEHLIDMYDGLLVISGGSMGMNYVLSQKPWIDRVFYDRGDWYVRLPDTPNEGVSRYHTLFGIPGKVWEEADERGVNGPPALEGLPFSDYAPPNGTPTEALAIDYPSHGVRHTWTWDEDREQWLSTTEDQLELEPVEIEDIDYLNDERIAFENVVLIYAEHWLADFIEDEPNLLLSVGVELIDSGDAVLLRDGQRYAVEWQRPTLQSALLLYGEDGELVPYDVGRTFYTIVTVDERYEPDIEFVDAE